MPLDSRLAAVSRTMLAEPLLNAPILATPLLDDVRAHPGSVQAWADARDHYDSLSSGEQVVFGWLMAQVWPDRPGLASSWSLWHAADRCTQDADSLAAIRQVANDLLDVTLAEVAPEMAA